MTSWSYSNKHEGWNSTDVKSFSKHESSRKFLFISQQLMSYLKIKFFKWSNLFIRRHRRRHNFKFKIVIFHILHSEQFNACVKLSYSILCENAAQSDSSFMKHWSFRLKEITKHQYSSAKEKNRENLSTELTMSIFEKNEISSQHCQENQELCYHLQLSLLEDRIVSKTLLLKIYQQNFWRDASLLSLKKKKVKKNRKKWKMIKHWNIYCERFLNFLSWLENLNCDMKLDVFVQQEQRVEESRQKLDFEYWLWAIFESFELILKFQLWQARCFCTTRARCWRISSEDEQDVEKFRK